MGLINKQNKALGIFILGVLILLGAVFIKSGKFRTLTRKVISGDVGNTVKNNDVADSMGSLLGLADAELDPITDTTSVPSSQHDYNLMNLVKDETSTTLSANDRAAYEVEKQDLKLTFTDLKECLGVDVAGAVLLDPRNIFAQDILSQLQKSIGSAVHYVDKKVS